MATDIRVGVLIPSAFYVGSVGVSEIYLGSLQIWS